MGLYDRDYYREDSGRWWGAVSGRSATWGLIAVTAGVWLVQVATYQHDDRPGGQWTDAIAPWAACVPDDVLHGQVWRLVTCLFVHHPLGLFGVALGMIFLYFLGRVLEGVYGPRELVAFYLVSGTAVAAGMVVLHLVGVRGGHAYYYGAGAPLTALLVLFACHFPHQRVLFMLLVPMPAWLLVVIALGMGVIGLYGGSNGPLPVLMAAIFAFAYYRSGVRITSLLSRLPSLPSRRRRPVLRVVAEEREQPVAAAAASRPAGRPAGAVDEQLEAKLDQVLEKVARYGRDSLTPEERDILLRASEIYKRRRDH